MGANATKADTSPENAVVKYHAVVVDVVEYSKLTTEQQHATAEGLTRVASEAMRDSGLSDHEKCIALPTGDGVAFCLIGMDAEKAVELAERIRSACYLREPFIPMRIGIHFGRGLGYKDINGNRNIAGPGINLATRIASQADPGAIALSHAVGQDLEGTDTYRPRIVDLGVRVMKHDVKEKLWELYPTKDGGLYRGPFGRAEPGMPYRFHFDLPEPCTAIALHVWLARTDYGYAAGIWKLSSIKGVDIGGGRLDIPAMDPGTVPEDVRTRCVTVVRKCAIPPDVYVVTLMARDQSSAFLVSRAKLIPLGLTSPHPPPGPSVKVMPTNE